jgi:hypothetical protein
METAFEDLRGLILTSIEHCSTGSGEVVLRADLDRRAFRLYHRQDCCENVSLEEIIGDPADLLFTPIRKAKVLVNPPGAPQPDADGRESFTWTFYELRTKKGTVVLRWCGNSNGYYSEAVHFEEVEHNYVRGSDDGR